MSEAPTKGKGKKGFASKLKNMVKRGKVPGEVPRTSDQSADTKVPVFQFTPAPSTLDIMQQARENLTNFKSFIETGPPSASEEYDVVSATMSRAFSEFTNRTVELGIKLDKARTAAEDIVGQLKEKEQRKEELKKRIDQIIAEKRSLNRELEELQHQGGDVEGKIAEAKRQKGVLGEKKAEVEELSKKISDGKENLEKEKSKSAEMEAKLKELRERFARIDQEVEEELNASEARVKELTAKARQAEQAERQVQMEREKQMKVEKKAKPKQKAEVATFVINDNVKVSQEEINQLRFMVKAISEQVAELESEKESKMMDIDCLMQENNGLKQIIRAMTEGA